MDLQEARRPRASPLPIKKFKLKTVYWTVFWDMGECHWSSERRKVQHEIRRNNLNVKSVLLTVLTMKGTVLYDMTHCILVQITDVLDEIAASPFRAGEGPVCTLHHECPINSILRNIDNYIQKTHCHKQQGRRSIMLIGASPVLVSYRAIYSMK